MDTTKIKTEMTKIDICDKRKTQEKDQTQAQNAVTRVTFSTHGFVAGVGLACKCFTLIAYLVFVFLC